MFQDSLIAHRNDHIMANTWRLIFERQSNSANIQSHLKRLADAPAFENLLAEYRLIGLTLANTKLPRRYS